MRRFQVALTAVLIALAGCSSPPPPAQPADELTVGKVQGESPNIVTTDEKRREVWIYDKVSTDRVDTARSFGGTIIILGGGTSSAERSTTQRTLTIIIKFDEDKKVRDFSYNYSQF
jgi:uncharacterized protein (DUF1330 family)